MSDPFNPTACSKCGSADLETVLTPKLKHYGKLVCASCGHHLKWLPKPHTPLTAIAFPPGEPRGSPLPELQGENEKVRAAGNIARAILLSRLRHIPQREILQAMRTVKSAPWWLRNRDAIDLSEIRWPETWRRGS